jgi:hypothetical protein
MNARMEYMKHSPGAIKALSGLELYLEKCAFERSLLHLLKIARVADQWLRLLHRLTFE